jgi:hypothetical protein
MPSQRQLQANRRNGRKGGPNTQAGKQRSRMNPLKHGLTSTTLVVLPDELQHQYDEVLRGFRESFQPHNPAEEALVLRSYRPLCNCLRFCFRIGLQRRTTPQRAKAVDANANSCFAVNGASA